MSELKSLTMNGKTYDCFVDTEARAKAVSADYVEQAIANAIGGVNLSEYKLLGVTPQRLNGAENRYNIVVDATEETAVTIYSDTVADLSTAKNVRYQNTVETYENGVYALSCTNDGKPWYQTRKYFDIYDLVPGETYNLMYDVTGVVETDIPDVSSPVQIAIHDANGSSLFSYQMVLGFKTVRFTATTSQITVSIYPTIQGASSTAGYTIRYRDIWVNRADALEVRTDIYSFYSVTSERLDLRDICGGVTITTTPSTDVYAQAVEGDTPEGPLAGMTCVCFGDSITGNYAAPFDYPSFIARKTGMEVINAGFGGCRMAQHPGDGYSAFSMYSIADSIASGDWSVQDVGIGKVNISNATEHLESLKAVDWSAVDYITIFYGTNDFTGGVPIGEDDNSLATTQYKGALRYSIEKILTAYPKIRIVLLTPIYRFWTEDGTVTDSDSREVSGLKLTDYVKAVTDVADEYKLPVFNLYNSLGINKINRTTFLSDGVHPSESGRERIAESIAARLSSI